MSWKRRGDSIARSDAQAATASRAGKLGDWTRASEWWEDKLVPALGLYYLTIALSGASIAATGWSLAALLLALLPGAVYVSVVNDLTDRAEDRAAGKRNRWDHMPAWMGVGLLAASIAAGLCFAWAWRHDMLRLLPYLGAWAAFSCYSVPPVRLKVRGGAGVLADAAGAHLFPALLAAAVALRGAGAAADWPWLAAVGAWSLAYGLRGILWHQLSDADADAAAGVPTFVRRRGPRLAAWLGARVALPVELAALAAMLWRLGSAAAIAALLLYFATAWFRAYQTGTPIIAVAPRPRFQFLLQDYYGVFLPIAVLLASAARHPADLAVLALHLLLFHRRIAWLLRDLWEGDSGGRPGPHRRSLATRAAAFRRRVSFF